MRASAKQKANRILQVIGLLVAALLSYVLPVLMVVLSARFSSPILGFSIASVILGLTVGILWQRLFGLPSGSTATVVTLVALVTIYSLFVNTHFQFTANGRNLDYFASLILLPLSIWMGPSLKKRLDRITSARR